MVGYQPDSCPTRSTWRSTCPSVSETPPPTSPPMTTDGEIDVPRLEGRIVGRALQPPGRLHPRVHDRARTHGRAAAASSPSATSRRSRVSVDSVEDHHKWAPDIGDVGGTELNFPIIADPDRKVAELYDMIHPGEGDTSTVRSVFVIDPNNKVRLTLTYPKSVGRNFDEILRVIDALQAHRRRPGRHARRLDAPATASSSRRRCRPRTRRQQFAERRRGQALPPLRRRTELRRARSRLGTTNPDRSASHHAMRSARIRGWARQGWAR